MFVPVAGGRTFTSCIAHLTSEELEGVVAGSTPGATQVRFPNPFSGLGAPWQSCTRGKQEHPGSSVPGGSRGILAVVYQGRQGHPGSQTMKPLDDYEA